MANNVQIPAPFNKWLTIPEAAKYMGFKHSQYVRKLLKDDKLGDYVEVETGPDGQPITNPDGSYTVVSGSVIKLSLGNYERWQIDPKACDAYKAAAAASGGAFGQHAVRRMTLRFSTEHYTIEEVRALLTNGLGDPEVEGEFRWELAKSWQGKSKKKAKAATGAPTIASIVTSLVESDEDDDADDEDWDDDYEDDDDEDEDLDDVLA